jgi:hypothetical protein
VCRLPTADIRWEFCVEVSRSIQSTGQIFQQTFEGDFWTYCGIDGFTGDDNAIVRFKFDVRCITKSEDTTTEYCLGVDGVTSGIVKRADELECWVAIPGAALRDRGSEFFAGEQLVEKIKIAGLRLDFENKVVSFDWRIFLDRILAEHRVSSRSWQEA